MIGERDTSTQAYGSGHPARRNLHGRRQGRPLRAGRRRLLQELLPGIRIDLPPPGGTLDPAALFARKPEAVWLEIGFGSGEHLAWQASRNPGIGVLGAEYFVNGVAALLQQIEDRGLDNVRILQGDARMLMDALPSESLARAFILFPDPWPKTRHHKRRIVQHETLTRLATLMTDGAELRIATDDPAYQGWILEHAAAHPSFCWPADGPGDWRARPADWPPTRYEQKAIEDGRRPAFLRFRRRVRSTASGGRDRSPLG
jgi:tRNA (guanine-N7-)-methyltransferase